MSASSLPSKEQEENVSVSILEQADAIMRPDRAEGGRMQSYFVGATSTIRFLLIGAEKMESRFL